MAEVGEAQAQAIRATAEYFFMAVHSAQWRTVRCQKTVFRLLGLRVLSRTDEARMQKQTRKVYETVIYDPSRGSGAAGDCSHVIRSTSRATVEKAARGRTYYGAPATVRCEEVPIRLFQRWQAEGKV